MDIIIGLIVLFGYPYATWAVMHRIIAGNWRFWEED